MKFIFFSYHEQLRLKGVVQMKLPIFIENSPITSKPALSPYNNYNHKLENNLSSDMSSKNLKEKLTIDDESSETNENKNETETQVTSNKNLLENQLTKSCENEPANDAIYMETNSVNENNNIQDLTKSSDSQIASTNSAIFTNNNR